MRNADCRLRIEERSLLFNPQSAFCIPQLNIPHSAIEVVCGPPFALLLCQQIQSGEGREGMNTVTVYGADWCGDTKRTRRQLDELGVAYDYIDVEQDEEASRWVKQQNEGKERKPTIKLGEQVLSVPSNEELESVLRDKGIVS
jgi:mycoredoxin